MLRCRRPPGCQTAAMHWPRRSKKAFCVLHMSTTPPPTVPVSVADNPGWHKIHIPHMLLVKLSICTNAANPTTSPRAPPLSHRAKDIPILRRRRQIPHSIPHQLPNPFSAYKFPACGLTVHRYNTIPPFQNFEILHQLLHQSARPPFPPVRLRSLHKLHQPDLRPINPRIIRHPKNSAA